MADIITGDQPLIINAKKRQITIHKDLAKPLGGEIIITYDKKMWAKLKDKICEE